MFRLEAELSKIGVGNSPAQLMIALAPIQSALYVATEGQQVDEIEQIDATDDIVIFPECPFGAIPTGIRTQLTDDHILGRRLQGKRQDNSLGILPFVDDQGFTNFANRLE